MKLYKTRTSHELESSSFTNVYKIKSKNDSTMLKEKKNSTKQTSNAYIYAFKMQ